MRISRFVLALAAAPCLLVCTAAAAATAAPAPALKLERIVMLMRHGIRPPTKANPVPKAYSSQIWPSWPVGFGLLTPRGAAGARLLGVADRAYVERLGLIGDGCPTAGTIVIQASGKSRAIRTAESWRDGFMPGCATAVNHPDEDGPDPIFHGLDDQPASFDGQRAWREAMALAPAGGFDAEMTGYRGDLALMAQVLDCPAPTCPALTEPSRVVAQPHDRPGLEGPADVGSTASQTFLLEYLEGMPMNDVGWGRLTRSQIEQLLRFHPLKFKYSNRPDYVATRAAAPLAGAMLAAMTAPATRVALFTGHDTNIADVGGFYRLHWQVPQYPADDIPPGSALGFELLSVGSERYVRAFYRAQTMDQLREQRDLTGGDRPYRAYLAIPGCGNTTAATGCTLNRFKTLTRERMGA